MIPVSVIITTRNESTTIERCLSALGTERFGEIVVIDSNSEDDTKDHAKRCGAQVSCFTWNKNYPKKRQWCMDNLELKYDWVFFVDADEVVTEELISELEKLFENGPDCAGYFVRGHYVLDGKVLKFGLRNNKLCLLDRRKMEFPVVDDLDVPGMGEIEGHYQPVLKRGCENEKVGQVKHGLLHYAYDERWEERHRRYAAWEVAMNRRNAWPDDPVWGRQMMKRVFRSLPGRGVIAFLHCYILKGGVLDGRAGLGFALSRYRYYRMIAALASSTGPASDDGSLTPTPESR